MARLSRCQSLPPDSNKSSLQASSSGLAAKRQFFSQLAEAKNEAVTSKTMSQPRLKKYPLLRSKSQDSSAFAKSNLFLNFDSVRARKETLSRASSETRDLKSISRNLEKIISPKKVDTSSIENSKPSAESLDGSHVEIQEKMGLRRLARSPTTDLPPIEEISRANLEEIQAPCVPDETNLFQASVQPTHIYDNEMDDSAAFPTQKKEDDPTSCDDLIVDNEVNSSEESALPSYSGDQSRIKNDDENPHSSPIRVLGSYSKSFSSSVSEDTDSCSEWSDSNTWENLSELSSRTDSSELLFGRAFLLASLEDDLDPESENFIAHPHSTPNSPALPHRRANLDISQSTPGSPLVLLRNKQKEHLSQSMEGFSQGSLSSPAINPRPSSGGQPTPSPSYAWTLERLTDMFRGVPMRSSHPSEERSSSGHEQGCENYRGGATYFRSHRLHTVPARSGHGQHLSRERNEPIHHKATSHGDVMSKKQS